MNQKKGKSKENTGPDLDRIGLFKEMSYHHEYVPMKICEYKYKI